jgi:asparagine synthase (glutamine-hydrolysing)
MTLTSGIYGLFRLDGAPVDPRDAGALGLHIAGEPEPAHARAVDERAPTAAHRAADEGALTLLLGDIEEPEALAARLNLARSVHPAILARAALRRFGGDTPGEMIGEWALLHWDRASRLTLMMSAARRDRLLFAISGARVAVAPDLFRLSRIPWIGTTLDEAGLLFALGRADLRANIGDRTMLARVRQLEPGTRVTIGAGEFRKEATPAFVAQPRWTGSFEDAMVEAEDLMRRIMRSRLARTAAPAALLSGGLDSSTLAWLAAEERGVDQKLMLITSVAPPGSGLSDEAEFADAVADRLGLKSEHVAPPVNADIYRPPEAILGGASGPPLPVRHCLTETFQVAARKRGATLLIDGIYGEMTMTGRFPSTMARHRLRRVAAYWRRRIFGPAPNQPPLGPFHVRLSSHRLAELPETVRSALRAPVKPSTGRGANDPWGYEQGAEKALLHPNEFYPGAIRMELPYRDLRLLRLFAGFPAKFLAQDGLDRAPARHMLAGRLPDSIRLRTSGLPASPDHTARLQRQAPAARARIAAFRGAEIQEWLDLDWLDGALARIAERGPASHAEAYETQLTAITAEFMCWWRARS